MCSTASTIKMPSKTADLKAYIKSSILLAIKAYNKYQAMSSCKSI